MRLSEKQRNEPPVKLTRAEKREIQAIIRKYKGDGKAHSAQASIPYQSMYPDGICKVTANTFSKCIEFADISYPRLCVDEYMKRCLEIRLIQAIVKV